MAQVATFVNKARARTTAFLQVLDDINALGNEYTALGGTAFLDGGSPAYDWTQTDMTRAEFLAMLTALQAIRNLVATGTNARDLYRGKV